jgi:hypothetical protein
VFQPWPLCDISGDDLVYSLEYVSRRHRALHRNLLRRPTDDFVGDGRERRACFITLGTGKSAEVSEGDALILRLRDLGAEVLDLPELKWPLLVGDKPGINA